MAAVAAAGFAISAAGQDAAALDKVVVGKVVATAITFTPIDVGLKAGIWKKNGLDLEYKVFRGDAQNMQALTAGTTQIALGSGPALAFVKKGVPAKGVAAFANAPLNMVMLGDTKANVKTIEDLKGKKIGVTSAGALTFWLVRETSQRKGWGTEGITPVPLGATNAQLAAMERGEIQGRVGTLAQGIQHESEGSANVVIKFGDVIGDFITHVIYARNDLIESKPQVVQNFVNGWWESVNYMKNNREESVTIASDAVKQPREAVDKAFDTIMQMLTEADGSFRPDALKTLSRSFVELKILDAEPDMTQLFTTQFLPPKPAM
jgi:ABC-type nitrate/sulfonate/bicarbonate transport system substrate-binding protein